MNLWIFPKGDNKLESAYTETGGVNKKKLWNLYMVEISSALSGNLWKKKNGGVAMLFSACGAQCSNDLWSFTIGWKSNSMERNDLELGESLLALL